MTDHINLTHEFYEVLNAFPCLEKVLGTMNIDLSSLHEGLSVYDFFSKVGYEDSEIDHLLKKLNFEVNHFLKTGKLFSPASIGTKEDSEDELGIEMIA